MTMPEFYSASHSHAEAGSFQIYYKGMLASDSGYYTSHGIGHHSAYTMQTISSNSILVNNPALKEKGTWNKGEVNEHPYSGGQSLVQDITRIVCPYTLESAKTCAAMDQLTVLGKSHKVENDKLKYVYLAGDMTKAYDEESVDEVTRHIISAMTSDEDIPMVFATFDRISAKDKSFKKTVLLHSQTAPVLTDDGFIIITNTKENNSGKLVVRTLHTDMTATVLGNGNGEEYTIGDKVYKPGSYNPDDPDYRIDLCPATESKTDRILTLMYVTDAENESAPITPLEIKSEKLLGASVLGQALLFPKDEKILTENLSFTTEGEGELHYYVMGVSDGEWTAEVNGIAVTKALVKDNEGILTFTAPAGKINLSMAKKPY
jgi:heparin/heparan-sulfate lyase